MEGTLCIDVGGSKYLAGAISADGKLLYCQKYTWQKHDRGNRLRILQKLFDAMDELVSLFPQYAHSPMGMTVPGLADSVRGIWISCAFLGIGQLNIGQLFSRRYGVPLYLENDANACAVAEYHWGKGKGCQSFMYLTISNSIGSALFLGGDIYQGSSQTAGEIGMCLVEDLLSGDGLRRYPLEDLASGRGLAQNYQRISHCYSEQPIAADVLAALAEKGDSSARKAFELEGIYLPQNEHYVSTCDLVKKIAQYHDHKILFISLFNPFVRLFHSVSVVNKVFGNLIIDPSLSAFSLDYQRYSFDQSIQLTEKGDTAL